MRRPIAAQLQGLIRAQGQVFRLSSQDMLRLQVRHCWLPWEDSVSSALLGNLLKPAVAPSTLGLQAW